MELGGKTPRVFPPHRKMHPNVWDHQKEVDWAVVKSRALEDGMGLSHSHHAEDGHRSLGLLMKERETQRDGFGKDDGGETVDRKI